MLIRFGVYYIRSDILTMNLNIYLVLQNSFRGNLVDWPPFVNVLFVYTLFLLYPSCFFCKTMSCRFNCLFLMVVREVLYKNISMYITHFCYNFYCSWLWITTLHIRLLIEIITIYEQYLLNQKLSFKKNNKNTKIWQETNL